MSVDLCRTCGRGELEFTGGRLDTPTTRSVRPGPDGLYQVQPHHRWCPVYTGQTPEVGCPRCGAPVEGIDYRPGYQARVPAVGPDGRIRDDHVVGTLDGLHAELPATLVTAQPRPAPQFDKAYLALCGHTVEGADAQRVFRQVRDVADRRRREQAEATIERHAGLLSSAEAAGYGQLVLRYRQAVHCRSADAPGILTALRTVAG
ncbi:hypothetical protein ABZY58_11115 [Micromonospora tulbaghiae]|uniref:hypothetical protein n=1 Tax=Micromonospora tulbaghiae TaxID=479978 RepID=UPI0033AFAF80